ncbi:hypothetical protein AXF42_Ash002886 [Apostasia shenzhenica]|uniref:Uncharacterized protein n=1 Tax=Apostasia shenzhenica TaxID=1088818 RepID=A0A2I0A7J4_9ASPA|nr:hypothetical protein AXF42_Ash002886 [Apostasia shenzhenica]
MEHPKKALLSLSSKRGDNNQAEEAEQKRRSAETIWITVEGKGRWDVEQDVDQRAAEFIYKEHQRMSKSVSSYL